MKQSWSIAWRQLMKEKRRVVAAVAGITFAVLLMLVQLGFEQALFKSVSMLYAQFDAQLFVINPQYQNAQFTFSFTQRRLQQALAVDGVASASPVYLTAAIWKNPVTQEKQEIFVIAIPAGAPVMALAEVNQHLADLRLPNTVLYDADSREEFGPIVEMLQHGPVKVELTGVTATVAAVFHMGTSMATNGNIIISDENLKALQPDYNLDLPNLGLIRVKSGADIATVQKNVQAALGNDVQVLTRTQIMDREIDYWASHTPIGFVFRLGLLMGLIVGSVVVYQILYNDVSQHLDEYATLKAMGYPDRFLFRIVLFEALILSIFGFIPGVVFTQLVYSIAHWATLLPLQMNPLRVTIVYLLTVGMCAFSGALATRRLRNADPAEIF
jgi:putative ABC transport system permease protein